MTTPAELYCVKHIRAVETRAIKDSGIAESVLMARAGVAAFEQLIENFPEARSFLVLCGGGNNGGDGYVVARLAHQHGLDVRVAYLGAPERLSPAASDARKQCEQAGVICQPYDDKTVMDTDVIVDALLGIGLNQDLHGPILGAVEAINNSESFVFSVDIPTGLNADTGAIMGDAVVADMTVTFIGIKQGMLTGDGVNVCGSVYCSDLDLPNELAEQECSAVRVDAHELNRLLPPRQQGAYKGDFGHVLVVGGDCGMSGAVRLSAEAALRSGAGLVSVATRQAHSHTIGVSCPEIMCHAVESATQLTTLLAKATVIVLGPGLGSSAWSTEMFNAVLSTDLPLVIDASALTLLADSKRHSDRWILTPHPGEAAQLMACSTREIQSNRFQAAVEIQKKYGGVVVLKGAGTLIQAANKKPVLCDQGNPGMASGGMGDVLSGVVAGLRAQQLPALDAALAAVVAHANAGDSVAWHEGPRGMLASDLLPYIRHFLNQDVALGNDELELWQ